MSASSLDGWTPRTLSVLRIVAALVFMAHGTEKILGFPQGMHPPVGSLPYVAGLFELIGGALLLIGLFTRPIAFVLSGEMAFAYFLVHAKMSFFPSLNHGDAAILFCFVFLYIVFAGPGPWSADAQLRGAA